MEKQKNIPEWIPIFGIELKVLYRLMQKKGMKISLSSLSKKLSMNYKNQFMPHELEKLREIEHEYVNMIRYRFHKYKISKQK